MPFGVLYFAASIDTCFAETIVRDRRNAALGETPISLAELSAWNVVEIEVHEMLNFVDLTGERMIRMGIPTDVARANDHRLGRRWSVAFWDHASRPDGIHYRSRLTEDFNICVYDRALPRIRATRVRQLMDCHSEMTDIITRYRLAIV